ncbi:MAG: class I SAM-dependent methyltransferase, partial [Caldilineaceae bacterium]
LNRIFYASTADEFNATRQQPWPGFDGILPYIPAGEKSRPIRVLDVGCGNGRFASYLADQGLAVDYTGVDASLELLDLAHSRTGDLAGVSTTYQQADLANPEWSIGLTTGGLYDLVACFATFHHLPGADLRQRVLADLARLTAPAGVIAVSYWQFLSADRFQAKLADWAEIGLSPDQVDPGDALLPWKRGPAILRYVHQIEDAEARHLATVAHLPTLHTFRADGKEGDLNLYHVLGAEMSMHN